jgi:hypothetical protein
MGDLTSQGALACDSGLPDGAWVVALEELHDITPVICSLAGLAYTVLLYIMKRYKLFIINMLLDKY